MIDRDRFTVLIRGDDVMIQDNVVIEVTYLTYLILA